ncbi:sodium:alanine symporter family protein [Gulosibacter sp. 10]|uniref:alanine/glycine:cation symporter family protein n=1 Tax=Gulosibacter sp. 10 TaxID=1255570 RepID=UPI00097F2B45|nr:alanine/glycine:cation symporter family protein [Gulosibacter sp. 10]SJM58520.1 Amino-acid carrier protein AlsT [Gulosibacter sp. 10]
MEILSTINSWIWDPLAYFALGLGLFFTFLTKGVQFRRLPDMIRQLRAKDSDPEGLSSFQTLALTLSSRVGVGSISGVATAIAMGGPGAIMWMAITGLLGSTTAYAEAVLAQTFKRRVHGEHRGGMPYYIKYGLKAPWLAFIVAIAAMIGYGFVFPGIQVNNIASSARAAFGIEPWVTAIVVTAALAIVIIGGTKRIVQVAQTVVPFMAIGYVLTALVIIAFNLRDVPEAIAIIINAGSGVDQIFGGIVGWAVAWGVRRAVFASATGFGEGTFSAAAAKTTHPGKQGIIQAFSIYIDILMICMATGLMIVVTGKYNVANGLNGFIVEHVPGLEAGPNFVQAAIDTTLPGWGSVFVALAILFFAFTSQVFFFYVATTNLVFLLGDRHSPVLEWALKIGALTISFVGAIIQADMMWAIGDIGYGTLAWLNMLVLVLLTPIIRKIVRDYDYQRKKGLDPLFDPGRLGITGAVFWEEKLRGLHTQPLSAAEAKTLKTLEEEGEPPKRRRRKG